MRFHSSSQERGGHSLFAFILGATTALLAGGYYLFGPRGRENHRNVDRWLKRAKFEILDRIENIENLTEDQYHKIVDEVTFRQGQLKGLSQTKMDQLRENLRHRWYEMREAAKRARDEARKEIDEEESSLSTLKDPSTRGSSNMASSEPRANVPSKSYYPD